MITIEVGNSYSQIKGLKPDELKTLRKALSYQTDPNAAYHAGTWARTISMVDKKGVFPTGLYQDVKGHLYNSGLTSTHKFVGKHATELLTPFKLKLNHEPRKGQAIPVVLTRGTISACTGYGKSLMILLLIKEKQVKTLIIVPTLTLKAQLIDTITKSFGSMENITVENIGSPALKTATDYGMLVIDEAHHAAAKTYHKLNKTAWTGIFYRFCFTATPFRNNDSEQLLYKAIAGDVIHEVTYTDALAQGAVVPVEGYYISVPKKKTASTTWSGVYSDLVINNEPRNLQIAALLLRLHHAKASTLCLVKEIAHGEILAEMTGLPFINGQDNDSRQYIEAFANGEIPAVIATTGVMGEGVDTRACEYVIVAGLGKAKSAFMQICGRGVRRYPEKDSAKVVLFSDNSHKWTKSHYKTQVNILIDEYNTALLELKI